MYHNLCSLYEEHHYPPSHIWNCDETEAQAGCNGGSRVFAKRGAKNVHTMIPNEHEWVSVLVCINASGEAIPNFYSFKGKQMRRNFLELANVDDTMAMQPKAWMTAYTSKKWGIFVLVIVDKSFRPFVVVYDNSSKFLFGSSSMNSAHVAAYVEDIA